jgi:glycosyltransferase involved in cell wall biosynthesis
MKVAIVHYWLVGMRGGERVLEELCRIYPTAVIITHVSDRAKLSKLINKHEIRETFIARLPWAKKLYQKYLSIMPFALEMVDMSEFDLVISSESGPAKGIIIRPDALHVCYCHSPMRYIWDHFHIYRRRTNPVTRLAMTLLSHRLRIWDVTSASRVDAFICNSRFVAQRVRSFYRREAIVVHPPVSVDEFLPLPFEDVGEHYLMAGELSSYKRPDLVIGEFTKSGKKLRVIGDGEQRKKLEAMAGVNIEFLGKVSFLRLKEEYATCRALVFPGEEDFGIVPVEVMAAGRPVIAFGRGGLLDSVIDGVTGLFFSEQTEESLANAIYEFETYMLPKLDVNAIVSHAQKFAPSVFRAQMTQAIANAQAYKQYRVGLGLAPTTQSIISTERGSDDVTVP